ncbi:hypothetical protein PC9H_010452 [Pleurotus ostreatus]|uniref:Uncharacterized protein n=1 Tax=Pleurotus ostreatus TaxID=5322 RepID=A0A8H6ZMI2_PLEOS|nr:uncharacterized protein PC9H_010452 [Pleurotus ostreatus]KAF7422296.1 hypothetical protein PC9H_010452 [Pleurotus ostreatus]
MLLTFTAEVFLTLRVFALLKRNRAVPAVSIIILSWQWGIALYAMSQSSQGTVQNALLLSRREPPLELPMLPNTDPYHICLFITTLTVAPWVEAYLCLSLAFDSLAFMSILYAGFVASRHHHIGVVLRVVYRDGIVYFFVLFSSNLVWLLLLLYARTGLKLMHNQAAMVISSIMINRITLNLKEASTRQSIFTWSTQTFRQLNFTDDGHSVDSEDTNGTELRPLRRGV